MAVAILSVGNEASISSCKFAFRGAGYVFFFFDYLYISLPSTWILGRKLHRRIHHADVMLRHTPHAGAANVDGGVTIDMQSMNQVEVSEDQKIVSIGPGNRWGNIYPTLDEMGVAMVGGRASGVGTAGLITGGM